MAWKLGTHLVELGFIGTDQLSLALSRQMGVPAALERHFSRANPAVLATLKASLAVRYLAVPLAASRSGSKQVVAAMAAPLDMLTVDDLSFALGARVEPLVAAEIVVARNIRRLYGADVNIKSRKSLVMPAQTPVPGLVQRLPHPAALTPAPAAQSASKRTWPATGPAMSLEDAIHRLTLARHREQLADIVVDFMRGYLGCGMVFMVRDGQARVWRGFAPGIQEAAIETIAFPVSMPSCFQLAHDSRTSFRGPAPAEGRKLQRQIWKYLHCEEPAEVGVVPVQVKNRVLNLVYAHTADGGPLPEGPFADLQALCAAVSSSYVRMIQKLKQGEAAASTLGR